MVLAGSNVPSKPLYIHVQLPSAADLVLLLLKLWNTQTVKSPKEASVTEENTTPLEDALNQIPSSDDLEPQEVDTTVLVSAILTSLR